MEKVFIIDTYTATTKWSVEWKAAVRETIEEIATFPPEFRVVGATKWYGAIEHPTGKCWGSAGAGLMFVDLQSQRILLLKRSPKVSESGTWGIPGGAYGREAMTPCKDYVFTTFIVAIKPNDRRRMKIVLDEENTNYKWFTFDETFQDKNLHPGVAYTLKEFKADLPPCSIDTGDGGETLSHLRTMVKQLGIRGYSRMKRKELCEIVQKYGLTGAYQRAPFRTFPASHPIGQTTTPELINEHVSIDRLTKKPIDQLKLERMRQTFIAYKCGAGYRPDTLFKLANKYLSEFTSDELAAMTPRQLCIFLKSSKDTVQALYPSAPDTKKWVEKGSDQDDPQVNFMSYPHTGPEASLIIQMFPSDRKLRAYLANYTISGITRSNQNNRTQLARALLPPFDKMKSDYTLLHSEAANQFLKGLRKYTTGIYSDVNDYLRYISPGSDKVTMVVNSIISGIDKSRPLQQGIWLWRGVRDIDMLSYGKLLQGKALEQIVDFGFSSFTYDPSIALGFLHFFDNRYVNCCLIKCWIPAGTKGLFIESVSTADWEREFLSYPRAVLDVKNTFKMLGVGTDYSDDPDEEMFKEVTVIETELFEFLPEEQTVDLWKKKNFIPPK